MQRFTGMNAFSTGENCDIGLSTAKSFNEHDARLAITANLEQARRLLRSQVVQ